MKYPIIIAGFLFFLLTGCGSKQPQVSQDLKTINLQAAISAKRFIFKARTALPTSGRTRQLTSEYDLQVLPDSVIAYLPYFGRAYSAPVDPSQGGIKFTSTDFEYTSTTTRNDGWEILIRPKDARDIQQLRLTISKDGYGNLQVTSINRQAISFNGYTESLR